MSSPPDLPSSTSPNQHTSSGASSSTVPTYASFPATSASHPQKTSPLLSSTPPSITKALCQIYPYILALDKLLGLLTWTEEDSWQSFLVVATWIMLVLYYEILVVYFGHLIFVGGIAGYVWLNKRVEKEREEHPTLDAIVHVMGNVTMKMDILLLPLTSLNLTEHDVTRLLFTTLFISPVYMITSYFFLGPRKFLLILGVFLLSYHSLWAKVTRQILWRSRSVRIFSFYLTGLDFTYSKKSAQSSKSRSGTLGVQSSDGQPVRFTYCLYENQRRWLGIGWTPNLLAYERTPWTDEFLNETNPPDTFRLPDAESSGMKWQWVDKTWRLDLTNDGALVATGSKSGSTADPNPDDGWIFYDNTWKKPSSEDTYSKYTRRRRWVRTAELMSMNDSAQSASSPSSSHGTVNISSSVANDLKTSEANAADSSSKINVTHGSSGIPTSTSTSSRKRRSIRFDDSVSGDSV
ncbi:Pex24p-domain-containing protein [Nadsonia fulvescens var. elongata DSM 6958]|uniref:Pex24p-domain-containing protein n=1 Tax=Nadsonia fulvescens var. elongata DSM 6958 TaxID=857566 RepID=A0A1E3PHZ3_9ASCO|nr:Pex24p-domain-containing protein [Nadsonia fulvescens var. elongata DSM 6958]